MTELDAVNPVPANNVARSAIASFLVALLSLASINAILSPFAIAPAVKPFKLSPSITSVPPTDIVLPDSKSIPPSSIVKISEPSTLNTILPALPPDSAVAVVKVTDSAALLELPLVTLISNDSVAEVPILRATSALLASLNKSMSALDVSFADE